MTTEAAGTTSRMRWIAAVLLAPSAAIYVVCFIVPTGLLLLRSIYVDGRFTGSNFAEIASTPLYVGVIWTTFRLSLATTALCLLLGYPIAMLMVRSGPRVRATVLILVIVPYWLDYIVRTYSWMVLLGRNGLLNQLLVRLGMVQVPQSHLSTDFAVVTGMTQVMLPLMILSLFAGMTRIDQELMRAAAAHGAGAWRAFQTVFLPLSLPGVIAGSLLTFVNALAFYITPALLGGPKQTMISQSIDVLASRLLDWPLASAASVLLLAATLPIFLAFHRFVGLERQLEART